MLADISAPPHHEFDESPRPRDLAEVQAPRLEANARHFRKTTLCCRDMAQRARSRCQFLAARPHGVMHWHHHISTVCIDLSSSLEFRENVYESCSAIQCVLVFCSVNNCLLRRIKQKDLQGCDQGVHESVRRDSDKRLDTRIKNADARMHHSKTLPTD